MPLKLSLKPDEVVIVNGAVIRNGDRRGVMLLENQARILREKDIMMPEQAKTPAKRAYFAVMQLYLTGDLSGPSYDRAARALSELLGVARNQDDRECIVDVSADLTAGLVYKGLGRCKSLIKSIDGAGFNSAAEQPTAEAG